jgi:hypothetical protein
MTPPDLNLPLSRRRALALGGGLAAGGLISAGSPIGAVARAPRRGVHESQHGKLPADRIQQIVQVEGTVTQGVLSMDVARSDIGDVAGPLGVTFTPAFEIDGTLTFQPLGHRRAFFNGDIPVKPEEANPVIDAIVANGLVFQAFHQHYIETTPNVWFIHFRGLGDPLRLAQAVHNVLKATSTPLPQTMPAHPTTPLDADRLAKILHGDAQVGDEGVVTVSVSRKDRIVIDGVEASPEANISTEVQFKPLAASGASAAVGPDFSMTGSEAQPVVALMRHQGWFVGCLYNQETEERPQLFFSHMLKTGDAYALAREVRAGVDKTNAD